MNPLKRNKQKQFIINIISNGILFVANALIGLWMTPFLLKYLDLELYGMIPLANQITSYFSLLTLVITGAVGRFLSIDILREDHIEANKTFNTILFPSLAFSFLLFPFVSVFILLIPNILKIPSGYELEIKLLFLIIFLVFFLNFVQTGFSISSWAKNRFDLRSIAILVGKSIQVGVLVFLYGRYKPSILFFGISFFISNLITFAGHYFIWKKLTPELTISIKYMDIIYFRHFLNFGKWIIIDQIGTIFLLNFDLVLSNRLLGPKVGGEYGSILLIPSTIRVFILSITSVISPMQMEKFALSNFYDLEIISTTSVRIIGYITALFVGLVCGFSREILRLWLGDNFSNLWLLLVLLSIPLSVTLPFQTLYQLQIAYKKIKLPALVTFGFGLLNIIFSIILAKYFNFGAVGIAFSCGLTFIMRTTFFSSIYGALIQKLCTFSLLKELIPGLLFLIFVIAVSLIINNTNTTTSLINLIITILITAILCSGICFIFLPKRDKTLIFQLIPKG